MRSLRRDNDTGAHTRDTLNDVHVHLVMSEEFLLHTIPPFESRPSGFGDGDDLDEAFHVVFGYAVDVQSVPVSVENEDNISRIAFRATPIQDDRVMSGHKPAEGTWGDAHRPGLQFSSHELGNGQPWHAVQISDIHCVDTSRACFSGDQYFDLEMKVVGQVRAWSP